MKTLPNDIRPYGRSRDFTHESVPAALLSDHATKRGVWGLLHIAEGRLRYIVPGDGLDVVLTPDAPGVVEPEVPHRVEPLGPVRFWLEYWR